MKFFISYSRIDKAIVERLQLDLQNAGIDLWIDTIDLIPGTLDWEESLREAIRETDAVILVASPDSRRSLYVKGEIAIAKAFNKPIYPVWVAGDNWIDVVPLEIMHTQYADLRDVNYKRNLALLIRVLINNQPKKITDETPAIELAQTETGIEQSRVLETAMPACTPVGDKTKLKIKVSLPPGVLKDELPDYFTSRASIQPDDVQSSNFQMSFQKDKETGRILPGHICVEVMSDDFIIVSIDAQTKSCPAGQYQLSVPENNHSRTLNFILNPKESLGLGLATVVVRLYQNGELIVGTYVETQVVRSMQQYPACDMWNIVRSPSSGVTVPLQEKLAKRQSDYSTDTASVPLQQPLVRTSESSAKSSSYIAMIGLLLTFIVTISAILSVPFLQDFVSPQPTVTSVTISHSETPSLTPIITPGAVNVTDSLMIADFNNGSNMNNVGCGMGTFSNDFMPPGVLDLYNNGELILDYTIDTFAGFWIQLCDEDFSKFSQLTFDIVATDDFMLKIELKGNNNQDIGNVYINVSTTQQSISIDLSEFGLSSLSDMSELVFVIEDHKLDAAGASRSGTITIDNIKVISQVSDATSGVTPTPIFSSSILVIADFDDGSNTNNLGCGMGTFSNESPISGILDLHSNGELVLDYTINTFAGFWIQLCDEDFSAYSRLSFDIIGTESFDLRIELKNNNESVGFAYFTVSVTDQPVSIDLSEFGLSSLSDMSELVFVIEDHKLDAAGASRSGIITIDNIVVR